MRYVQIWKSAVVVLGLAFILGGCAAAEVQQGDNLGDFDVRVADALEEARSGGASEAQLAIVEQAGKEGSVTFEDAKVAVSSAISCMAAAGIAATYEEDALRNGVVIPGFTVKVSEDPALSNAADVCEYSESYWVNKLYQTQPSAIDANLAFIEKQAPVIRQCLEDAGYDTDPDATGMDLVLQSAELDTAEFHCALDAGVMGY